jgi:hypothetical protein
MIPNLIELMESTGILKVLRIALQVLFIVKDTEMQILALMSALTDKNYLRIEIRTQSLKYI